jgi:hypothetical protein
MTDLCTIDASCEATGHPTECTEPVSGSVTSDSSHNVTISANGVTKEVATIATASMDFPSHSHDYTSVEGCHQNSSHSIDPDTGEPTITINGSPVYLVKDSVTTDPISGGDVNIVSNPSSTGVSKE